MMARRRGTRQWAATLPTDDSVTTAPVWRDVERYERYATETGGRRERLRGNAFPTAVRARPTPTMDCDECQRDARSCLPRPVLSTPNERSVCGSEANRQSVSRRNSRAATCISASMPCSSLRGPTQIEIRSPIQRGNAARIGKASDSTLTRRTIAFFHVPISAVYRPITSATTVCPR
jgi:hypothetical protein